MKMALRALPVILGNLNVSDMEEEWPPSHSESKRMRFPEQSQRAPKRLLLLIGNNGGGEV